ncbi:MAG: redoxin [Gammaproteobacteria bacterium HGW-Gammaproteobacteria-3]|nr:MAG: redoxin [Gammaproteobacteria bacterium HGW-Gammaproteobacteria-3]
MKTTPLLIVLAAVIALATGALAQRFIGSKTLTASSTLPEFNLPDLQGSNHSLADWKGKVIIINFWATWCPPCRKEIPEFIALQKQYGDKGLQFIGIALEEKQPVAEFIHSITINYPILVAGDSGIELARQMGNVIGAVPFSVVLDRQGRIVHSQPGELSRDTIIEIIEPLL